MSLAITKTNHRWQWCMQGKVLWSLCHCTILEPYFFHFLFHPVLLERRRVILMTVILDVFLFFVVLGTRQSAAAFTGLLQLLQN